MVEQSTTLGSALGQLLVFASGSVLVFRGDLSMLRARQPVPSR